MIFPTRSRVNIKIACFYVAVARVVARLRLIINGPVSATLRVEQIMTVAPITQPSALAVNYTNP